MSVALDGFKGHPVGIAVVDFDSCCCDEEDKLVLKDPVKPNDVGITGLEREGTLYAFLCKDIDEFHANFSPLDGENARGPTRKLDSRHRASSRYGDLEVVLLGETFDPYIGKAMVDAEHLEVALIEEGAFHLVYGIEGDRDLSQFEVVSVSGHIQETQRQGTRLSSPVLLDCRSTVAIWLATPTPNIRKLSTKRVKFSDIQILYSVCIIRSNMFIKN